MSEDSGIRSTPAHGEGQAFDAPVLRYAMSEVRSDGLHIGRDTVLNRPVLMRRAEGPQAAELQRQAQFLAQLNHAGIGPIHDLTLDETGATVVLGDVGGMTLAEAAQHAARGKPIPELSDPAAVIVTFLKLCDIITCVHERRVVHHAVSPEHVRIGNNGQVVLAGWGAALAAQEAPATKRFVGRSPASADNLALDGLHEDIRGLGLCLFTALTGEAAPRTANGTLGDLDLATRSQLPINLEAVVREAVASDTTHGYQSVGAFASDLRLILAGVIPVAKRPNATQRGWDWAGRHRLGLAIAAILVVATGIMAGLLAQRHLQQVRAWGEPLVVEGFHDATWMNRWEPRVPETWVVADGRALSTGLNESSLIFKRRLTPPLAVEYTASIARGAKVGDLSLWWCEEPGFLANQRIRPYSSKGWLFQLGAYENTFTSITRMPAGKPLAMSSLTLVPERDYRVRVEIEDCSYRVFVDGALIMHHTDLLPAGSGYVSLFGYFPGKAFTDVRISQRELPPLVSPLAVGDGAYQDGRFADAAAHYGRVAEAVHDVQLANQALLRQGLAERRAGDPYQSIKTWKRITDPALRELADCLALEDLIAGAQHDQALERFRWFWQNRPAVRETLVTQWVDLSSRIMLRNDLPMAERMHWYDLRGELFADEPVTALSAAQMLLSAGRMAEVLKRFPQDHRACGSALLALGRDEELLAQPWASSRERGQALYNLGRLEELAADRSVYIDMQALALVKLGRFDEAMAQTWGKPWALVFTGRAEEILGLEGVPTMLQNAALMVSGRLAESAGAGIPNFRRSGGSDKAKVLLAGVEGAIGNSDPLIAAIGAIAAGDAQQARAALARVPKLTSIWREPLLGQVLLAPLIEQSLGDPVALQQALEKASVRTSRWDGLVGQIAAAALDPAAEADLQHTVWRSEAQAWLLVAQALRGEAHADRAAALAAWRGFLALPRHERLLSEGEPALAFELTAAWRINVLDRP